MRLVRLRRVTGGTDKGEILKKQWFGTRSAAANTGWEPGFWERARAPAGSREKAQSYLQPLRAHLNPGTQKPALV